MLGFKPSLTGGPEMALLVTSSRLALLLLSLAVCPSLMNAWVSVTQQGWSTLHFVINSVQVITQRLWSLKLAFVNLNAYLCVVVSVWPILSLPGASQLTRWRPLASSLAFVNSSPSLRMDFHIIRLLSLISTTMSFCLLMNRMNSCCQAYNTFLIVSPTLTIIFNEIT